MKMSQNNMIIYKHKENSKKVLNSNYTYILSELLSNCYRNSLLLAKEYKCKSIAFPLISTGTYRFPKDLALMTAIDEIKNFLLEHEMLIYLVVFDTKAVILGEKFYPDLEAYIDHNYVLKKREEE